MILMKCEDCGNEQELHVQVMRVVDGKVVADGEVCPECGGKAIHANPKKGIPSMSFTDSGTGKRVVK